MTPLLYACEEGYLDICKLLIENGASMDAKSGESQNHFRQSPLHFACSSGNEELVKYLLSKRDNINELTSDGITNIVLFLLFTISYCM